VAKHELIFDSESITATVTRDGDHISVEVEGKPYELRQIGPGLYGYVSNGSRSVVAAVRHKGVCYLDIDSVQIELSEPGSEDFARGAADQHAGQKDKIFAPMPGKIVKIMVAVGDKVEIKQPMVIVEAMKMENQVNSRAKGTVRAVNFKAGDQVDTERPIIELDIVE
jgi:biotin carboxyl carrier protein